MSQLPGTPTGMVSTSSPATMGGGPSPPFGFPNLAPLVNALNTNANATVNNINATIANTTAWHRAITQMGSERVDRTIGFGAAELASMQRTSNVMGASAGVGAAGIMGAVGTISPSTISTFTGSLRLLTAEIGTAFVPFVKEAAFVMQDWAVGFQNLDEGTKSFIARITIASVMTLGIGAVVVRIAPMIAGLGTAFLNVGRAITLGLVSNPVIASLIGVGAVVGTLIGLFSSLGGSARRAGQDMNSVRLQEEREQGLRAVRDLPEDVGRQFTAAQNHEARLTVLRQHRQQMLDEQRQMQAQVGAELARDNRDRPFGWGFMPQQLRAMDALDASRRRLAGLDQLIRSMGGKSEDFVSPVRARFTDATSYRESVQMAALNVPQTEADLARRQMEELNNNMGGNGPLVQSINNMSERLATLLGQMRMLAP